jgi:hypothetical protein
MKITAPDRQQEKRKRGSERDGDRLCIKRRKGHPMANGE